MPESFGARLRRQREEQNIELGTIAEQTKIKGSLLEALERDDVSRWPSGIFRRAYIRAYAQAIGLSPDVVLREFLEVHPDPEHMEPIEAIAAVVDGATTSGGPPTRLSYIVGSAIASLSRRRAVGPPPQREVGPVRPSLQEPHPVQEPAPAVEVKEAITDAQPALEEPMVATCGSETSPALETATFAPDILEFAQLCTGLGRVDQADQLPPLLEEAARILGAAGLIVWMWDRAAAGLRPALVHGYSERVVAHLPAVPADDDNVTAAAFRSAEACVMEGGEHENGALAVPLLIPGGCAGVLALELPSGREHLESVRAVATIFAALLAQLTAAGADADARALQSA